MTGPNPDAELDEALGINRLPPAAVTDEHVEHALLALFPPARYRPPDVADMQTAARRQVERVSQAIADAEQRGAARVLAEREAAGTCPRCLPGDPSTGAP